METIALCNLNALPNSPLSFKRSSFSCPFTCTDSLFTCPSKFKPLSSSSSSYSSSVVVNCSYGNTNGDLAEGQPLTLPCAYDVLGVDPQCSSEQLKSAFRAKVKQFHPDVAKGGLNSDAMIRRVIEAYEILSKYSKSEIIERECMDPFDQPECEALDIFVNEVLCVGKGCPYSCVNTAPHAFKFSSTTGFAQAASQGVGEEYKVRLAVGQCPQRCIHYVTPSQRIILEELLDSIVDKPYDTSVEAELLYALIVKATRENNRYQEPKKNAKVSTSQVDWF